jgi:pteridine reductase
MTLGNQPSGESPRRVALVTGAGRRVGAAIASALLDAGWTVALHHHASPGEVEALAATAPERTRVYRADLSDAAACSALVDGVLADFGRLDLLVSSAAVFERVELEAIDAARWDRTMALNVRASFLLAQRAAHALGASEGSIVLLTCTSASLPYGNFLPYVVSKGAARQLMRALAIELAPHVRVNAVAPGTVLPPEEMDDAPRRALADRTLVKRLGSARDVADAVLYLAGARFVTGHEILVDGGVVLAGNHSGEG